MKMKKNDQHKLVKEVSVGTEKPTQVMEVKAVDSLNTKPIEVVEPTNEDAPYYEWETGQLRIGAEVAHALAVLTAAGVIEWQLGGMWMRTCVCIHAGRQEPSIVFGLGEFPEGADYEVGEVRQEFDDVDDAEYKNLMYQMSRNWRYGKME